MNTAWTMRPNEVAKSEQGQLARKVTYTYDAFRLFEASETNELLQKTSSTYDTATGAQLTQRLLPQGAVTPTLAWVFDGFGRLREMRGLEACPCMARL